MILFYLYFPLLVLLPHAWSRPLSHLASATVSLPAGPHPFSLPPPKRSTIKYKHSCSCVTPWLKSDTFFIVYGKRYTFLHMLSKALWAPPAFLILCPFNVMRTWADCNHSGPSKSSCAFPGLSLPLTIEGHSTLSPYPNNIHSSDVVYL